MPFSFPISFSTSKWMIQMSEKKARRIAKLKSAVEEMLGEPVLDVETPGGSARASCRVVLRDRTIIATKRPNFRRTHLEALVLKKLSPTCQNVPKFLGLKDDILLQSDVGGKRLSQTIHAAGNDDQLSLAADAIAAIFNIHVASQSALEGLKFPPLGMSETWMGSFFDGADLLDDYSDGVSEKINYVAIADILKTPPQQFIKWDCRSGNAAIHRNKTMCWFDFEYCGMRHGAEDIAWLIADESWPIFPEDMFKIVSDLLPNQAFGKKERYLNYLSLYTTFHALQRLNLVLSETKSRGWRSKELIIERDDVGRNPEFGANICVIGAYCADRSPLTRPLVQPFLRAAQHFADILNGDPVKRIA
jgi:hypothetical protein